MGDLRLVRPEKKHEKQAMGYLEEFYASGSEIHGTGGLDHFKDNYDGWLEKLTADRHRGPDEGLVPSETFFLVKQSGDGDERIIGMVDIRLVLNDRLWQYGGNIGYSIRPTERKKGYAKAQLFLALKVCQQHGMEAVLIDCDKDNIGSAKTMQALGGKLLRQSPYQTDNGEDIILQHYVIDIEAAIAKYSSQYEPLTSQI